MNRMDDVPLSNKAQEALRAPIIWRKDAPIYVEIYRRLQKLIVDGVFRNGNRLPSEGELSQMLQVGRTSLRSAIILLYEDGYVKTYHGKGTYVVYNPAENHADEQKELHSGYIFVREQLEEQGGKVEVVKYQHRENTYDSFIDERLQLHGKSANVLVQLMSVDGIHAALSYCYHPSDLFDENIFVSLDSAQKHFHEFYNRDISYVTSTFTSVPASGLRNADIEMKVTGKQILLVSSTWYSKDKKPLVFCKDYFCSEVVRYKVTQPAHTTGDLR